MTKTDAIRKAIEEGISSPSEAVVWIKKHLGVDVSPSAFSNVKSTLKREGKAEPTTAEVERPPPPETRDTDLAETVGYILQVQALVGALGKEQVRQILDRLP